MGKQIDRLDKARANGASVVSRYMRCGPLTASPDHLQSGGHHLVPSAALAVGLQA